jgi:hypothetical protein
VTEDFALRPLGAQLLNDSHQVIEDLVGIVGPLGRDVNAACAGERVS